MNINKLLLPVFLLFTTLSLYSCTNNHNEGQTEVQTVDVSDQFVQAVEANQPDIALSFLTEDARTKINSSNFFNANGDLKSVIEAFRQAGISTRKQQGISYQKTKELPVEVKNLAGNKGFIRVVLVNKNGEWRIANILNNK